MEELRSLRRSTRKAAQLTRLSYDESAISKEELSLGYFRNPLYQGKRERSSKPNIKSDKIPIDPEFKPRIRSHPQKVQINGEIQLRRSARLTQGAQQKFAPDTVPEDVSLPTPKRKIPSDFEDIPLHTRLQIKIQQEHAVASRKVRTLQGSHESPIRRSARLEAKPPSFESEEPNENPTNEESSIPGRKFLGARLYIEYPTLLGVTHKRICTLPFCSDANNLKLVCTRDDQVSNYTRNKDWGRHKASINLKDPAWKKMVDLINGPGAPPEQCRASPLLENNSQPIFNFEPPVEMQPKCISYKFPDDILHPAAIIKKLSGETVELSFFQVEHLLDIKKPLNTEEMDILMEFCNKTLAPEEISVVPPSFLSEYLDPLTGLNKWEFSSDLDHTWMADEIMYPVKIEDKWQMLDIKRSDKSCNVYTVCTFDDFVQGQVLEEILQVFSKDDERSDQNEDPDSDESSPKEETKEHWFISNHGLHPSQSGMEFSGPFAFELVKYLVSTSAGLPSLRYTASPAKVSLLRALMKTSEQSATKEASHDDNALLKLFHHACKYTAQNESSVSMEEYTVLIPKLSPAQPSISIKNEPVIDQSKFRIKKEVEVNTEESESEEDDSDDNFLC